MELKDTPAEFAIAGRKIGSGHPVFIIAEVSANHHQDIARAKQIIAAAAESGADAVKLQTYTANTLTLDCDTPPFHIGKGTIWEGRTLHGLYAEAFTPWEWHGELFQEAAKHGLVTFSSPFDATAVAFLEELNVPAYKVASFELVDLPLLRNVAATGKPIILSTGMATRDEIAEAVTCLKESGAREIALLKCNSGYPAKPSEMNLRTLGALRDAFGLPVGLSDHTLSSTAAVVSVALGGCIIEKHITLSRAEPGPDSAFSLEPVEFAALVREIRDAEAALGKVRFEPTEHELASRKFRRSLFVVADVGRGEKFTASNVRSIRPADGLHTRHLARVLQARAAVDLKRGTPLAENHLA